MKNKGFTLVELMVAMAMLAIVIVLSSSIFNSNLASIKTGRRLLESKSNNGSVMESNIIKARSYAGYYLSDFKGVTDGILKPDGYDSNLPHKYTLSQPIVFSDGSKSITRTEITGYYLSVKNGVISYNSLSPEDNFATFIGVGHKPSPTSEVSSLYLDPASGSHNKNFAFHPMTLANNMKFSYAVNNVSDSFSRLRVTYLRSQNDNQALAKIYPAYAKTLATTSEYVSFLSTEDLKKDSDHSKSFYKAPKYKDNKAQYLNDIDKSYVVSGVTLNKNGKVGHALTSLDHPDSSKAYMRHLIGLPYIDHLAGFYDHNLLIDKDNGYSIFNLDKNSDKIKVAGNTYEYDWQGKDVRDVLNLPGKGTNSASQIHLSKGLAYPVKIMEDDIEKTVPNIQKSFGNSLFYSLDDGLAKVATRNNVTVIAKVDLDVNQEKGLGNIPVSLLSFNYDPTTGQEIDGAMGAFSIVLDQANIVHLDLVTKDTNVRSLYSHTDYPSIANDNLYSGDAKFQFDTLTNDTRKNMHIFAFTISDVGGRYDVEMFHLKRKANVNSLQTDFVRLLSFSLMNTPDLGQLEFFKPAHEYADGEKVVDDVDPTIILVPPTIKTYTNAKNGGLVEVTDLLVYHEVFSQKNYGSSNYLNLIMDYLYRKTLTDNERKAGAFDSFFAGKY